MISAFSTTVPTATMLMELNGWNLAQNDIAAVNSTATFNAATWGFDINQLGATYRADFLDDTLAALGIGSGLTDENTPLVIDAADILTNDTDLDGDTLTIASVFGASHGAVSLAMRPCRRSARAAHRT